MKRNYIIIAKGWMHKLPNGLRLWILGYEEILVKSQFEWRHLHLHYAYFIPEKEKNYFSFL